MISLGNIYKKPNSDREKGREESNSFKNNKKLLLILGLLIILAIILILNIESFTKNTGESNSPIVVPNEPVIFLNPSEIEAERTLLPSFQATDMTPSLAKTTNDSAGSSTSVILTEEEASDKILNPVSTNEIQKSPGDRQIFVSQPTSPTNQIESSATVYSEPNSNVTIKDVSISYANSDRNLSDQVRKGTLQTINFNENYLLMVGAGKVIKIGITSETKFYINNKRIEAKDLLLGDVLEVNGQGYNTVSEITANTIKIVAQLQFTDN